VVTAAESLPVGAIMGMTGYRLVNSKFPPIHLFDDVASHEEFEVLHQIQALTNPRLQTELGRLNLLPKEERPYGIPGFNYAIAPFCHINPDGSRFADENFGVLYVADTLETAVREVAHHQQKYWSKVKGLQYERLVLRGLYCQFGADPLRDATGLPLSHAIYDFDDYSAARELGRRLYQNKAVALQYWSVRNQEHEAVCWALFTPRMVTAIQQTTHYEMIWDGKSISQINRISASGIKL
jgi:hypothetical protein